MRFVVGVSLTALACAAFLPALAQSEEKAVPVVQASFHVPAMKNEYGTVLIINIPPGRNSGFHIHSQDSFSVNIEAADMTNQNFGSSQVTPPNRAQIGRILWTPYYEEGERTHKATNVGPTHFHNVSFLFASRTPHGFTPSTSGVFGSSGLPMNIANVVPIRTSAAENCSPRMNGLFSSVWKV